MGLNNLVGDVEPETGPLVRGRVACFEHILIFLFGNTGTIVCNVESIVQIADGDSDIIRL